MTMEDVLKGLGVSQSLARLFMWPIDYSFKRYSVTNIDEMAIYLANVMIETMYLKKLREDMYYTSPKALRAVFPSYFRTVNPTPYLKNPVKLGNYVYNGRNGNIPGTGDGYAMRGGGLLHITGRSNYVAANPIFNGKYDIVKRPEDIELPYVASMVGMFYFKFNKLDDTLRKGGTKGPEWVCNRINTGRTTIAAHQLEDRLKLYHRALVLLKDYVNSYNVKKDANQETDNQRLKEA